MDYCLAELNTHAAEGPCSLFLVPLLQIDLKLQELSIELKGYKETRKYPF